MPTAHHRLGRAVGPLRIPSDESTFTERTRACEVQRVGNENEDAARSFGVSMCRHRPERGGEHRVFDLVRP